MAISTCICVAAKHGQLFRLDHGKQASVCWVLRPCADALCLPLASLDDHLQPENILLSDMSDTAQLKVIDYGTSDFCRPGQVGLQVICKGIWGW
jgi:hypothetical protein